MWYKSIYSIVPINYADKKALADRISEVKDDLCLILYSGHAGSDMLLLDDQEASADGFRDLLKLCPKLQLVVLNGLFGIKSNISKSSTPITV